MTHWLHSTIVEQKTRRYRTEGQRQQGKGSFQKWGV